jgi:hypothetical protein
LNHAFYAVPSSSAAGVTQGHGFKEIALQPALILCFNRSGAWVSAALAKRAERFSLETLASATTMTIMSCWQHILLKTPGMPGEFTCYNFAAALVIQDERASNDLENYSRLLYVVSTK